MKKIVILTASFLFLLAIGIMAVASFQNSIEEKRIISKKVGLIMNGEKNDSSWCQSHYEGLKAIEKDLNIEIVLRENVLEKDCTAVIQDMVKLGCIVIVAQSAEYEPYMFQQAKENPQIYFLQACGTLSAPNYASYFGRIYQMRYLSGIVAGLKSKTNEIGYVAAMKIPEVLRGIDAFTLGVRSVNPDCKVHVVFTDTWLDEEKTALSTIRFFDHFKNIDVVSMHTNCQSVLQLANERKIWSIGYNLDSGSRYPETYLTAPVWNWKNLYYKEIHSILGKKFIGRNEWYGEESGIMGLAELTQNVAPGTEKALEKSWNKFLTGTFDAFFGPVYDNSGKLRVQKGENISDAVLLNELDWFVEGVDVYE